MRLIVCSVFVLISCSAYSQNILGRWKTIDDETGKGLSIVEIFQVKGKVYGKIIDILNPQNKDKICNLCDGDERNKPLLGLTIIKGLEKDGAEYSNGTILDPKSGKQYSCYITLDKPDRLKVRGFLGISLLGRTQYWHRVK